MLNRIARVALDLSPVPVIRTALLPGSITWLGVLAWLMVVEGMLSTGKGDHNTMSV